MSEDGENGLGLGVRGLSSSRQGHASVVLSGYRCSECGATQPHEDREAFYESGLCGWCRSLTGNEE